MKNLNILLINNNADEIEIIQKILDRINLKCTLHIAKTGEEALDKLMGSSQLFTKNFLWSKKIRPDIILVNEYLSDIDGIKFLEIIRKYYSLKNIKVFLLTDFESISNDTTFDQLAISGYLQRPFHFDKNEPNGFNQLESELNSERKYMTLIPFTEQHTKLSAGTNTLKGTAIKGKIIFTGTYAASAKITACAVTVLLITAASNDVNSRPHRGNIYSKEIIKTFTKNNIKERIDSLTFKSIESQENNLIRNRALVVAPETVSENLSTPDSMNANPKIEVSKLSSFKRPDKFSIKVTEEQDSLSH